MIAPNELRAFQLTLGKYLRSPDTETLPLGIDARRARVYEELLFKNVSGFINSCFPVLKRLTKATDWNNLIRDFFKQWRATSPLFKDIPEEFLQYLQQSAALEQLPPWFFELAHYEWVELYIDTADVKIPRPQPTKVTLNQPLLALIYQWPVHQICQEYQPNTPQQSCIIVYRNNDNQVNFIETNPATILLLQMLEKQPLAKDTLYAHLAAALKRPLNSQFKGFCEAIIKDLTQQSVLI